MPKNIECRVSVRGAPNSQQKQPPAPRRLSYPESTITGPKWCYVHFPFSTYYQSRKGLPFRNQILPLARLDLQENRVKITTHEKPREDLDHNKFDWRGANVEIFVKKSANPDTVIAKAYYELVKHVLCPIT